ncbi:MAG TPA: GAF domain-containing protein [Acetobacteraceae bacterium]|nr:GAF domain-containing protein [Acetobacteraceae bacterium]
MTVRLTSIPAFGEADLSNCEREQIHLAGSIQPCGALLVAREPELAIVQASANAAGLLGLDGPITGRPLTALPGDLASRMRPLLELPMRTVPASLRCHVGARGETFDALLHRPPAGGLVIELARADPPRDLSGLLDRALHHVLASASLRSLCDEAARFFREVTGYDRVMAYRFDEEGHGEVFAEDRAPHLEPYLGNHYPASDIPQIARRLYVRNRIRVLVDVDYVPVPVQPRLSPLTGRELDMSLCFLRSISPLHLQYLKNMGVAATMVASLVVGGRLWGLIACHHYAPRLVPFEVRAVAEVLAEAVAIRIAALESFAQAQAEIAVRRLEQRMVEAVARKGDWRAALFDGSEALLQPLGATGAALLFEDETLTVGEVPGTPELRAIGAWLDVQPQRPVFATAAFGLDAPEFAPLRAIASGLVAVPLSEAPGEYLIWFRPERIHTVTWGGDPFKPVIVGNDPTELSPRRSFAQWHQEVVMTSAPWTPAELTSARLIGETLTDVVLQFRAVRTLIARDQLAQVEGRLGAAAQPVLIADPAGAVILSNRPCRDLLQAAGSMPARLEDLAACCADAAEIRRRLAAVLRERRYWRGDIRLRLADGGQRPLMLRVDPVQAAPGRVLGFVVMLTDLTERNAAAAARRAFQDGVVDEPPRRAGRSDSRADLTLRRLLLPIVENAQVAALEITDGVEMARIPEMLDSVRASVARAAELLEHMLRRAR